MSDYALHREAMRIVEERLRNEPFPTPIVAKKKTKKKKPYKSSANG